MSNRSRFFSSSNPMLSEQRYQKAKAETVQGGNITTVSEPTHMTVQGAVNKSFIMAAILIATAFVGAFYMSPILMWGGMIAGLVTFLVALFNPKTAPITAPLYAGFQGLFIGTISGIYASALGAGVIINSVFLTLAALGVMLLLYKTGVIKPTKKFQSILTTAIGAIMVVYLVNFGMHMFGFGGVPYLHTMTPIGIGISLVVIGIAALSLILDFHQFEVGEQMQAPKYMEWLSAMGLMVTLIWLYLEILRLVAMFSSSD